MQPSYLVAGDCEETSVRVGFPPVLTIAIRDLAFALGFTHVKSLSIMAAVAPATIGESSPQIDTIRSDIWPEKGTERFSDDSDEVRFVQDGRNTTARILGE